MKVAEELLDLPPFLSRLFEKAEDLKAEKSQLCGIQGRNAKDPCRD